MVKSRRGGWRLKKAKDGDQSALYRHAMHRLQGAVLRRCGEASHNPQMEMSFGETSRVRRRPIGNYSSSMLVPCVPCTPEESFSGWRKSRQVQERRGHGDGRYGSLLDPRKCGNLQ